MNKSITILLMLLVFSGGTVLKAAKKKTFTGKITYKISLEAENMPEEAKAMMPKTMSFYIGENKIKSEMYTQMGMQSSIEDLENKNKVALLEIMGQKYALHESKEDVEKEMAESPEVKLEYTDETKEIAGYNCKKVIAHKTDDGSVYATAWVTDDLEMPDDLNFSNPVFKEIKGLLLEFDMETGMQMMMTFTAVEVEKKKLKDEVFEVPSDFKVTTREELMNTFGG